MEVFSPVITTGLGGDNFGGGDSVNGGFIRPSGVVMLDRVEDSVIDELGDR